jgi:hypothetical protein
MRKTLLLTLVLCVAAAVAYAQTSAPAAPPATSTTTSTTTSSGGAATTTTTKTTGGHKHKAPAAKKYKGTVSGVDQTAKSFKVASCPTCQDLITIKVNDKTKYLPKGTTWDDVKDGAKVSGTYKNDGTDNWALVVHIWKEKAPKAPKTGK